MPCMDGGPTVYEIEQSQKKQLDKYAQMLCASCKALEAAGLRIPDNTVSWWEQHKKQDAAREAAEREAKRKQDLREAALSKLSDEELIVLGLVRYRK